MTDLDEDKQEVEPDPPLTFEHDNYYGYRLFYENCYYIESKNGEMLIGSGLPSTEKEAREYCRITSIAYKLGVKNSKIKIKDMLSKMEKELNGVS